MVNKGSKIFFYFVFAFIFVSIAFTYYDTMILHRFDIFMSEEEIPSYIDIWESVRSLVNTYVQ